MGKKKRGGSGKENDGQTYVFVDQFDKLSAVKGPITGNHSLKQQNFKVAHEGTITCSSFSVILRQEKKKKEKLKYLVSLRFASASLAHEGRI